MKQHYYIHIGSSKTGSSTIQQYLFENRKVLQKAGVYYPKTRRVNHASLVYDDDYNALNLKCQKAAWRKLVLESKLSRCPKVVVSCEMLSLPKGPEEIEQIGKILKGNDVSIIYYLRRHDTYVQSEYLQSLKSGCHLRTPEEYLKVWRKDYLDIIESWERVFGRENMIIFPFEKSTLTPSLMHTFFDCIGEELRPEYNGVASVNVMPENAAIDSMLHIVRMKDALSLSEQELKFINCSLRYAPPLSSDSAKKRVLFTREQRLELLDRYRPQYEEIARRYVGRDDGMLFRDPILLDDDVTEDDYELSVEMLFSILVSSQIAFRRRLMTMPRWLPRYYWGKIKEKIFRTIGIPMKSKVRDLT